MRFEIIQAGDHMPDQYRDYLEGHRAVRLVDSAGELRGELVWRLATGHTVEITEFGLFRGEERRQGWGTRLLGTAMQDIRDYFAGIGRLPRLLYLFCEARNEEARPFYEARGFHLAALPKDFYEDGDAVLYTRQMR